MRIAIMGAGAIGGYYGTLLRQSGQEVVFLARGAQLQTIRAHGLRVESVLRDPIIEYVPVRGRPEEVGPVDLVLFTVKSYDSAPAAAGLRPLLGPETAVLTLQNGVDNVDVLSGAVGTRHVLGGLCQIFCHLEAPGIVRYTGGPRRVVLGEIDGSITPRAAAARDAFAASGVPVELSTQILVDMWEKYIFINAQGGMTALTRLPIGPIRSSPATFEMYLDVAAEVAAVGRRHGIAIPPGERQRVRAFAQALDSGGSSSLYNDLVARRRTELETLLGTVVRLGERYKVPTPNCRAIYSALLPHELAARRVGPAG
jgi:2-dehydropantoate 2-reductase